MEIENKFHIGLKKLGFNREEEYLYLCNDYFEIENVEVRLHLEKAHLFGATAVFFTKQMGKFDPKIYLYDFSSHTLNENKLTNIQKKVWSNGEIPIVCAFYNTQIKIIDCTQHIKKENKPTYLATIRLVQKAHKLYNEFFANKIQTGVFWEEKDNENKFKFNLSSYDILIQWIKEIIKKTNTSKNQGRIIKKVIIQSIMIKYLEERKDENNKSPFDIKYVKKYNNANDFVDVLEKNQLVYLLDDLQKDLNGNLFEWSESEKEEIKEIDFSILATALKAYKKPTDIDNPILELIRYYEFSYIPVELISRIYEEFLAGDSDLILDQKLKKKKDGIFYTPSHLAKLLVDEVMPIQDFKKFNINNFKILDPACGSGIFLVLAFKRLIEWWRLQNDFNSPSPKILKKILACIYGLDKEQQATKLTAFSLCLALCDALSPMQIISDLKFVDLTKSNILFSDFFIKEIKEVTEQEEEQLQNFKKIENIQFSKIIGNPPFERGAINSYSKYWNKFSIEIPQGQIALKFLSNSLEMLETNGTLCLIIKSSSLLYNYTSQNFKKILFQNYSVPQIFDFTALARNKSLWDNGADVGTAAVFVKNSKPDPLENILHLTFRRTKTTKNRIQFEVDEYDFNFINSSDAIKNQSIWKLNLLGGGRVKNIIQKLESLNSFQNYVDVNDIYVNEGFIKGNNGNKKKDFIYNLRTLPTEAIDENGINYDKLHNIDKSSKFVKLPNKKLFEKPNVLLKENIGKHKLPVHLNTKESFTFKDKVIGLKSDNLDLLKKITENFKQNSYIYRFYMFCTSSQLLINKNTAVLKKDYMSLPYLLNNDIISESDRKVINDVNEFYQFYLRNGENSKIVKKISKSDEKEVLQNYGDEFASTLNKLYQVGNKKFRPLSISKVYDNTYIKYTFCYDSNSNNRLEWNNYDDLDIEMVKHNISKSILSNRIVRLYNLKDKIILIKPNQYKYWLSIGAYKDADKAIIELTQSGY